MSDTRLGLISLIAAFGLLQELPSKTFANPLGRDDNKQSYEYLVGQNHMQTNGNQHGVTSSEQDDLDPFYKLLKDKVLVKIIKAYTDRIINDHKNEVNHDTYNFINKNSNVNKNQQDGELINYGEENNAYIDDKTLFNSRPNKQGTDYINSKLNNLRKYIEESSFLKDKINRKLHAQYYEDNTLNGNKNAEEYENTYDESDSDDSDDDSIVIDDHYEDVGIDDDGNGNDDDNDSGDEDDSDDDENDNDDLDWGFDDGSDDNEDAEDDSDDDENDSDDIDWGFNDSSDDNEDAEDDSDDDQNDNDDLDWGFDDSSDDNEDAEDDSDDNENDNDDLDWGFNDGSDDNEDAEDGSDVNEGDIDSDDNEDGDDGDDHDSGTFEENDEDRNDKEFGVLDYLVISNWADEDENNEAPYEDLTEEQYEDVDYIPDDYFDTSEYEA